MGIHTASRDFSHAQELLPEGYDISAWESVSVAPNGLITAIVPTSEIVNTEQPIDMLNFDKLGKLMDAEQRVHKGFYGQLTAIGTGIIIDRGNSHEISDGFHRHKRMSETVGRILINADPSITWEEHMHRKIGAAVPHTPLQYARVVRWTEEYWQLTAWGSSLSVTDAFTIAVSKEDRHVEFGLSKKDYEDIKHWTLTKADSWLLQPKNVLAYLRRSEGIPDVLLARIRQGSGSLLTVEKALLIAREFPDEEEIQLAVADAVEAEGYTEEELKLVVNEVASSADTAIAIEKLVHARRYMPQAKQQRKRSNSGNGVAKKPTTSFGLPRMRTAEELFDEFNARIEDVLGQTEWTPRRIDTAATLAAMLQQFVDNSLAAQEKDPKSALDQAQTLPTLKTQEERCANFAEVLDYYLQGISDYLPNIDEGWHTREVRQAIRRAHAALAPGATPSPKQEARMRQLNERVIAFGSR